MKSLQLLLISFLSMTCFSQNATGCFDIARHGTLQELKKLYASDNNIVDAKDANGSSMLILAAYYGNNEVAFFLSEKVKDINYNSGMGTALMAAVVKGNIAIVRKILQLHANVNAVDVNGSSALHYAVIFKNLEMVKLLMDYMPNLDLKDNSGATPFELAAKSNNKELISLIKH